MNINTSFTIDLTCKNLVEEAEETSSPDETYDCVELELDLTVQDAVKILFKFTPSIFKMSNGYTMVMKFKNDPNNTLMGMIIIDDSDNKYIIMNPQKFWGDVLEGFEELRVFDRIHDLSSIDLVNCEES